MNSASCAANRRYTVILPAYNAAGSIARCVESVALARKEFDVTLVIVDDGSTDSTNAICKDLASKYPWIVLHGQTNGGVAVARNRALKGVSDGYVAFIDSDDEYEDSLFTEVDEVLSISNSDAVVFGHDRLNLDGTRVSFCPPRQSLTEHDVGQKQLRVSENKYLFYFLWARVVHASLLQGLAFCPSIKLGSDSVFVLEMMNRARSVEVIPTSLYRYHQTADSITSRAHKKNLLTSCEFHYSARIAAHKWPVDEAEKGALLQDISLGYIENILIYLLNNLRYTPLKHRWSQVRAVRMSNIYEETIPNYVGRTQSLFTRSLIASFTRKRYALTIALLSASWFVEDIRRLRGRLRNLTGG